MTGVRGGRVRVALIMATASVGLAVLGVPTVVYGAGRPAHVRLPHRLMAGGVMPDNLPGPALPAPPSPGYLAPLGVPGQDSGSSPGVALCFFRQIIRI